jgi:hypothetical protein
MIGRYGFTIRSQRHHALHFVLQLAHIPRPVSTGEQVHDRGIELAQALVVAFRS